MQRILINFLIATLLLAVFKTAMPMHGGSENGDRCPIKLQQQGQSISKKRHASGITDLIACCDFHCDHNPALFFYSISSWQPLPGATQFNPPGIKPYNHHEQPAVPPPIKA